MIKKFLASMLAATMLISTMAVAVFAKEETTTVATELKMITDFKYDAICGKAKDGNIGVSLEVGGEYKYGTINANGEVVIPIEKTEDEIMPKDDYEDPSYVPSRYEIKAITTKDEFGTDRYTYYDCPEHEDCLPDNTLFKAGIYDTETGKFINNKEYWGCYAWGGSGATDEDFAHYFDCRTISTVWEAEDCFIIKENGKEGVFDAKNNKMVIDCKYEDIEEIDGLTNELMFIITENGKEGVLDAKNNKMVIDCKYEDIEHIDGLTNKLMFTVTENGKKGVLDTKNNKMVIDCKYEDIEAINESLFIIKENGKENVINLNGEKLLKNNVDDIEFDYDDSYVWAINNNSYCLYGTNGEKISAEFTPDSSKAFTVGYDKENKVIEVNYWKDRYRHEKIGFQLYNLDGDLLKNGELTADGASAFHCFDNYYTVWKNGKVALGKIITKTVQVPEKKPDVTVPEKPVVTIPTEDVKNDITNSADKKVEVNLSKADTVKKDIFKAAKGKDKEVVFNVVDKSGKTKYEWSFNGKDIKDTDIDVNLEVKIDTENKAVADKVGKGNKAVVLSFSHSGNLPGTASVKVYVGDKYKDGEKLFFYFYNEKTKDMDLQCKDVVVKDGYATVEISHCSDYVLTKNLVKTKVTNTTPKQEPSPNTGDTTNVTLVLLSALLAVGGLYVTSKKSKAN